MKTSIYGGLSLGLLFFLVVSLFSSCKVNEEITFKKIENVRFESVSIKGNVTLLADAIFHNPNDFKVLIKRTNTKVFIDEREVSVVNQDVGAEMPAREDFLLPIEIEIPAKRLFEGDIKSILGGLVKKKMVLVKFEGTVNVNVLGAEISIPYTHEEEKGLKL